MSIAELEHELDQLSVEKQIGLLDRALEKKALAKAASDLDALFLAEEGEKGLSWDSGEGTSGK